MAQMSKQAERENKRYEVRLLTADGRGRLFATAVATDNEAADYAKSLIVRTLDCEGAEVWCGMKLIRQL